MDSSIYRKMTRIKPLDGSFFFNLSKVQFIFEPRHEISNNVVCVTSKGSDQPAPRSLIRALASHLNILCMLSS